MVMMDGAHIFWSQIASKFWAVERKRTEKYILVMSYAYINDCLLISF